MWYEIIPAFAIITAAMAAPHGVAYVLNWLVVGNFYRRELGTFSQRLQYLRDKRLAAGDAYKIAGLENIPDEDPVVLCDTEECECPDEDEECEDNEQPDDQNVGDQNTEEQNQ